MYLRFFISLLFLAMSLQGFTQNPFDIKNRKAGSTSIEVRTNTEETNTTRETTEESIITTPNPTASSIEPTSINEVTSNPSNTQATNKIATVPIRSGENPFNVSHVPIRKNSFTKTKKINKVVVEQEKKDFFKRNLPLLFLFISLLILALVITSGRKTISNIIRSVYNENYLKQIKMQSDDGRTFTYVILYILFIINISLFFYLYLSDKISITSGKLYLTVMAVILTIYNVRHGVLFLLGTIFKGIKKETSEYSFTVQIYNIVFGLILVPFNFILAFGPEKLKHPLFLIVLSLLVLMFIIRSIRGVLLSSRHLLNNQFHFFLYLCICEIGPLVIFMKYMSQYI